ncbi:MAG: OsmC family peroxiredoxin, partial [Polynucleobacter sp.]|nr:OsmC family peroxiredoxin [Polynucleobacter sp.]
MTVVKEKTTIKMRMQGIAASHSRTDVSIRGLTKIIDEPVERGGTNLGMSPTETFA